MLQNSDFCGKIWKHQNTNRERGCKMSKTASSEKWKNTVKKLSHLLYQYRHMYINACMYTYTHTYTQATHHHNLGSTALELQPYSCAKKKKIIVHTSNESIFMMMKWSDNFMMWLHENFIPNLPQCTNQLHSKLILNDNRNKRHDQQQECTLPCSHSSCMWLCTPGTIILAHHQDGTMQNAQKMLKEDWRFWRSVIYYKSG